MCDYIAVKSQTNLRLFDRSFVSHLL